METFLFFVAAGLALAGALGVVLARNPVHSALSLVLTLLTIAVLFLLQGAQLVAAVQVIVYASAIVVLFLFVIMLLGVDREESLGEPFHLQRPAAVALGLIALAEVVFLAGHEWATGASATRGGLQAGTGGNVERVARSLFTDFVWAFEITAVLLVLAVVGGVVLARRSHLKPDDTGDAQSGDAAAEGPDGERLRTP